MTKRSIRIRIILWSVVALIALAVFISLLTGGDRGFFARFDHGSRYNGGGNAVVDQELSGNIEKINVDWIDQVSVLYTMEDENKARVIAYSDKENDQGGKRVAMSLQNGELHVELKQSNWLFFSFLQKDREIALELHLPKKEYDQLIIQTISGDILVGDTVSKEMKLSNVAGNIYIDKVRSGSVRLDSVSGKIEGQEADIKELRTETVSGATKLEGRFEDITASTISGDINVTSREMLSDWTSDTVSGSVSLTIPENDGFSVSTDLLSGNLHSDFGMSREEGKARFQFESISGNVSILKQ